LLEAIYVLCTLRSFRTSRLADLIALGAERGKIAGRVETQDLSRLFEVDLGPRGRSVRMDGKAVRPIKRYFGHFNVVLFAPEDLLVVRGSPGERRKFLDRAVWSRTQDYLTTCQDYEKTLKSRNQLLRNVQQEKTTWAKAAAVIAVYDQQLSELGAEIMAQRLDFLDIVREPYGATFESIMRAGLRAGVGYSAKEELSEAIGSSAGERRANLQVALLQLLESRHQLDRLRGTTSVGPHRDDLLFTLEDQPAATFASQGQTRAMVLAWKTALLRKLFDWRGEPPVLLLDDVSSELDPRRNEYLFDSLRELRCQCFITTTHPSYVLLDSHRTDWTVEAGRVEAT
jgi:DNA replication and repair protein RecF